MKIKSGQLIINKSERKLFELMIKHSNLDMSWGAEGTFGDGEKTDLKEMEKVGDAVRKLEWILENCTN